jgi:hypothetical protein
MSGFSFRARRLVPPVRRVYEFLSGARASAFGLWWRVRIASVYLALYYCRVFYTMYRSAGLGRDVR